MGLRSTIFGSVYDNRDFTPKTMTYLFDEQSGDTLVDSTGGNNGQTFGTLVNCLGKKHRSQIFLNNGSHTAGSYAIIPSNQDFHIYNKFTIEGFFTLKSVIEFNPIDSGFVFLDKRINVSSGDWSFLYYEKQIRVFVFDKNNNAFLFKLPITLEKDREYHIAAVINTDWNDCIKLYIDGVEQISDVIVGSPSISLNTSNANIKFNQLSYEAIFSAYVEFEGWTIRKNIALTQNEIQNKINDYNNAIPPVKTPITNDLLLHWDFNELQAPTVESVNNLSSTPTGSHTYGVLGKVNKALDFSGGILTYPHNSKFSFKSGVNSFDFAFSCYVKFNSFNNGWVFNKRGSDGSNPEYQLSVYQNELRFQIWYAGGSQSNLKIPITRLNTNEWIKISGFSIRERGVTALVINDKIVVHTYNNTNPITVEWFTGNTPFGIGGANWVNFFGLDGSIDQLKFWNGSNIPKGFFFHE